jgi:hypothetical protein
MSRSLAPAPPRSAREIKQEMVGLLTQSCHMRPEKAVAVAQAIAPWVFLKEDIALRTLRWWAVKCMLISHCTSNVDAAATIEQAEVLLGFVDRDEDAAAEVAHRPPPSANAVLLELYQALRRYQRGECTGASIGVGMLTADLSAVYLSVEDVLAARPTRDKAMAANG